MNLCLFERALPLRNEAAEGNRRLLGSQHPDTLVAVGQLGSLLYNMGSHAAAALPLEEAVRGLTKQSVGGTELLNLARFKNTLAVNARCLADPSEAAGLRREVRQYRLAAEAKWPSAAATVAGVQSRPELNGAEVTISRFLKDKGRYTVQLPPGAGGKRERINLKPANLVLAEGAAVVATGLGGASRLNGRKGRVRGWADEAVCYVVRFDEVGGARPETANLNPENCRADVLVL